MRSASMARRSKLAGAEDVVCPTYSSSVRGRMRAASGAWRWGLRCFLAGRFDRRGSAEKIVLGHQAGLWWRSRGA